MSKTQKAKMLISDLPPPKKTAKKIKPKKTFSPAKVVQIDLPRKVKLRKLKSRNAQQRYIKEKCISKLEKILCDTDTTTLSFRMRTCPTKEQLKEVERDPIAALLSFAINSGLGRFSNADHLHTIFELMKDPDYDSSVVPDEFKGLVEEIQAEICLADTERIVRQHNKDIDKKARLTVCAACGMRSFDMGNVHHHIQPVYELDILKCTEERTLEIENTDKEFREEWK